MILINLLPPELRRRRSGPGSFNPMYAGAAGVGVLALLMAGSWMWLKFSRLPYAEQTKIDTEQTLAQKTAEAERVEQRRLVITEFKKRRDSLFALLNRKVYWAKTLDDFGNLLTGEWSLDGFQVRSGELAIAELAGEQRKPGDPAKKAEEVRCSFRWNYKIIGDEDRSGDYVKSFFQTVEHGRFWSEHGFVGKPDATYGGDRPRWNKALQKVVVEGRLEWQRIRLAGTTLVKPAQPGQVK